MAIFTVHGECAARRPVAIPIAVTTTKLSMTCSPRTPHTASLTAGDAVRASRLASLAGVVEALTRAVRCPARTIAALPVPAVRVLPAAAVIAFRRLAPASSVRVDALEVVTVRGVAVSAGQAVICGMRAVADGGAGRPGIAILARAGIGEIRADDVYRPRGDGGKGNRGRPLEKFPASRAPGDCLASSDDGHFVAPFSSLSPRS